MILWPEIKNNKMTLQVKSFYYFNFWSQYNKKKNKKGANWQSWSRTGKTLIHLTLTRLFQSLMNKANIQKIKNYKKQHAIRKKKWRKSKSILHPVIDENLRIKDKWNNDENTGWKERFKWNGYKTQGKKDDLCQ